MRYVLFAIQITEDLEVVPRNDIDFAILYNEDCNFILYHIFKNVQGMNKTNTKCDCTYMLPQLQHHNKSPSSLSFGGSPGRRQYSVGSPSSVKSFPLILSSSSSGNNIINTSSSSRDITIKLRRRLEIIKEQRRRSRNNNKSVEKNTQKQQREEKEDCNDCCTKSNFAVHNIIVQSESMTTKDNIDFDRMEMEMEMASLKQQQQPQSLLLIDDDPAPSSSPLNISAVSTCRTFDETIDSVDTCKCNMVILYAFHDY